VGELVCELSFLFQVGGLYDECIHVLYCSGKFVNPTDVAYVSDACPWAFGSKHLIGLDFATIR
jgi:hypothetical protein